MKPKLHTFGKESLSIRQWADRIGISHWTLRSRLRRGWTIADALLTPVGVRINRNSDLAEVFMDVYSGMMAA